MELFKKYCKRCGALVDDGIGANSMPPPYKCSCKDEPLEPNEVISGHTRSARIHQLKAMHELMVFANDEGIYMSWIYTMPDEPSEEDFIDIAINDELYNECFDKFVKLIAHKDNRY